jgi:hypothetical protein
MDEEENKEEQTGLEKLKTIKLFEGKTLDEIFQLIFSNSIEERDIALQTFRKYDGMITSGEDLYMSGQHPQGYLDSAHKATENIIKMVTASQKLMDMDANSNQSITVSDIQTLLDKEGVAPERFVDNVKNEPKKLATGTDSGRTLAFPIPENARDVPSQKPPKALGENIAIETKSKSK